MSEFWHFPLSMLQYDLSIKDARIALAFYAKALTIYDAVFEDEDEDAALGAVRASLEGRYKSCWEDPSDELREFESCYGRDAYVYLPANLICAVQDLHGITENEFRLLSAVSSVIGGRNIAVQADLHRLWRRMNGAKSKEVARDKIERPVLEAADNPSHRRSLARLRDRCERKYHLFTSYTHKRRKTWYSSRLDIEKLVDYVQNLAITKTIWEQEKKSLILERERIRADRLAKMRADIERKEAEIESLRCKGDADRKTILRLLSLPVGKGVIETAGDYMVVLQQLRSYRESLDPIKDVDAIRDINMMIAKRETELARR